MSSPAAAQHIGFEATRLLRERRGIGRYVRNILRWIPVHRPGVRFTLFVKRATDIAPLREQLGAIAPSLLERTTIELLGAQRAPFEPGPQRPWVALLVGVNGVGKTTLAGKLAASFAARGHTPVLVAADTFRAAAAEQLEVWAQRGGVEKLPGQLVVGGLEDRFNHAGRLCTADASESGRA